MHNDDEVDSGFVEALKKIEPWLWSKAAPAWLPETVEGDCELAGSKFGGLPYLPDGKWPTCHLCNEPLQLFLQVNLADAPRKLTDRIGTGILQFFYCTTENDRYFCHGDCYGCAFEKNHVTRIIEYAGDRPIVSCPITGNVEGPLTIVDWEEVPDLPTISQLPEIGLEVPENKDFFRCKELGIDFPQNYYNHFLYWYLGTPKFDFEYESEYAFETECDKLGGWPRWVHDTEVFEACPICGEPANEFLGQVTAYDHLSYDFGDGGTAYLYRCPHHPDQIGAHCSCG